MYTVIALTLIGLVSGAYLWYRLRPGLVIPGLRALFIRLGICGGLGWFIGCIVAATVTMNLPAKQVVYGPAHLVAMRSSDGLSGTFIWGTGSIGSATRYNFMMVQGDGSMVPGSVSADGLVHITEDKSMVGKGTWTSVMSVPDYSVPMAAWALHSGRPPELVRHDFRVPVGTVVQQFSVK